MDIYRHSVQKKKQLSLKDFNKQDPMVVYLPTFLPEDSLL